MSLPRPSNPSTALALHALAAATDRLLATIDSMGVADFAAPSALPGWSRAHVLAHLALNAKGLTSALTTVGQPDPLPVYASNARRDADIARLAAQSPERIADRVAVGASMLAAHLGGGPTPEDALEAVGDAGATARLNVRRSPAVGSTTSGPSGSPAVAGPAPFATAAAEHAESIASWNPSGSFERTPGGQVIIAADVAFMRWREVEIHHADLDFGYRPADWSPEFASFLYAGAAFDRDGDLGMTLRATDGPTLVLGRNAPSLPSSSAAASGPLEISGSSADLAWWLVGRGSGEGLTTTGGPLPSLGAWVRR